jgi:hypothetical protein
MTGQTQSNNGDVFGNDGGADLWVVKLDGTGEIEWEKTFGGSMAEGGNSIKQTQDGGFIVAGYAWSKNGDVTGVKGKNDFWVIKLSAEFSSFHTSNNLSQSCPKLHFSENSSTRAPHIRHLRCFGLAAPPTPKGEFIRSSEHSFEYQLIMTHFG